MSSHKPGNLYRFYFAGFPQPGLELLYEIDGTSPAPHHIIFNKGSYYGFIFPNHKLITNIFVD